MSDEYRNASPMMEESNVGPSYGVDYPRRPTTPESSETSPTLSHATAAENPEDHAGHNLEAVIAKLHDVQVNDQAAGLASQDGHAQADGHANVHGYDNVQERGGLPQVLTKAGVLADLTTAVHEFSTWDDYKLICLAGPKITVVFDEAGGKVEIACSRKLLKDFSVTFALMDVMIGEHQLNISALFQDLPIKSATSTFIQLYEMTQAGGLPVPVTGDILFMRLVDLHIMADFLIMPQIKRWIETYAKAKIQELGANWIRDYDTARMLDAVPEAQRHDDRFAIQPQSPLQLQAAKLLDVQEAYMQARSNPRAKVVLPSDLARLVSDSCPAELRFRLEGTGQLHDDFLRILSIYDLKRRVMARRGVNGGRHH